MVVLLDYSSIDTVFHILLRQVDFRVFLIVATRKIILAIFILAATSSTMVIRISARQRHRPDCLVSFPWNIGVGTLADVG
jgi:hypothetical protein